MDRQPERAEAQQESENSRRKGYELFHDGELGRCPECGRLIMLPCLACQTREIELDFDVVEEKSILELELRDNEQLRYRQIRAYREKYGISMFEGLLASQCKDQIRRV